MLHAMDVFTDNSWSRVIKKSTGVWAVQDHAGGSHAGRLDPS